MADAMDAMTEEELIKFHDDHKGDLSLWESKPVAAQVKKGSVVFSLRFSPDELALLRVRSEAEGVSVGEFIRRAALRDAWSAQFLHFPPDIRYAVSWGTTASSWPGVGLAEGLLQTIAWSHPNHTKEKLASNLALETD